MYTAASEVVLPRPLEEVFAFFSDARNLELITPPFLHFEVLTPDPIEMRPGTLIDYRLRLRGIPLRWQSEITVWDPPHRFVDVQRRGPYRSWIHEHTFDQLANGTCARDHVSYDHFGGRLVNRLFVARDVRRIFDYRRRKLGELFGDSFGESGRPGGAVPGGAGGAGRGVSSGRGVGSFGSTEARSS